MNLYQEVILDHYKNPVGAGLREPFTDERHQVNPVCGDEITVRALVKHGCISDVSYECQGCSISRASASVMASLITEASAQEAVSISDQFISMIVSGEPGDEAVLGDGVAFVSVGRYPARVNCALIPWKSLTAILSSYGMGAS